MTPISYETDIRPLFRDKDIKIMEKRGLDLASYEAVRQRADEIYSRLEDETMPCDEPWDAEQIARFKRWIEEGAQP